MHERDNHRPPPPKPPAPRAQPLAYAESNFLSVTDVREPVVMKSEESIKQEIAAILKQLNAKGGVKCSAMGCLLWFLVVAILVVAVILAFQAEVIPPSAEGLVVVAGAAVIFFVFVAGGGMVFGSAFERHAKDATSEYNAKFPPSTPDRAAADRLLASLDGPGSAQLRTALGVKSAPVRLTSVECWHLGSPHKLRVPKKCVYCLGQAGTVFTFKTSDTFDIGSHTWAEASKIGAGRGHTGRLGGFEIYNTAVLGGRRQWFRVCKLLVEFYYCDQHVPAEWKTFQKDIPRAGLFSRGWSLSGLGFRAKLKQAVKSLDFSDPSAASKFVKAIFEFTNAEYARDFARLNASATSDPRQLFLPFNDN